MHTWTGQAIRGVVRCCRATRIGGVEVVVLDGCTMPCVVLVAGGASSGVVVERDAFGIGGANCCTGFGAGRLPSVDASNFAIYRPPTASPEAVVAERIPSDAVAVGTVCCRATVVDVAVAVAVRVAVNSIDVVAVSVVASPERVRACMHACMHVCTASTQVLLVQGRKALDYDVIVDPPGIIGQHASFAAIRHLLYKLLQTGRLQTCSHDSFHSTLSCTNPCHS